MLNREIIKSKCDRVLIEQKPVFDQILQNRICVVFDKHKEALGKDIDYALLTGYTADIITAFSGAVSEIMVRILQEVLSDE